MGNGSCSLATLWSSAKGTGELDQVPTAAAVAASPRWVAGEWARARWLLGWRVVAGEIAGGRAAVARVLTPLCYRCHCWATHFGAVTGGAFLQLEDGWWQVTEQLFSRMAAAAQIKEVRLCFWCPSGWNYREGRRDFVVMTKKIITTEATVYDKLAFNVIWGRKACASLSPSSSVSDQRWKPSRRRN